jgi:hypothetical protein
MILWRIQYPDKPLSQGRNPASGTKLGECYQLLEGTGLAEGPSRQVPFYLNATCLDIPIDALKLLDGRAMPTFLQHIGQGAKKSNWSGAVDVDFRPVKVAQRLLLAVRPRFEDNPIMRPIEGSRPGDSESELEGHVEPGSGRPPSVEFDSRNVVERVAASPNQPKFAIQTPLTAWNLERRPRRQPETTDPRDER